MLAVHARRRARNARNKDESQEVQKSQKNFHIVLLLTDDDSALLLSFSRIMNCTMPSFSVCYPWCLLFVVIATEVLPRWMQWTVLSHRIIGSAGGVFIALAFAFQKHQMDPLFGKHPGRDLFLLVLSIIFYGLECWGLWWCFSLPDHEHTDNTLLHLHLHPHRLQSRLVLTQLMFPFLPFYLNGILEHSMKMNATSMNAWPINKFFIPSLSIAEQGTLSGTSPIVGNKSTSHGIPSLGPVRLTYSRISPFIPHYG